MTEPELSPAQQEAVRRLLADARHDEPMPQQVADRLDGVIAELAATRATNDEEQQQTDEAQESGAVVSLDRERRARRWPGYLMAAAAVAAIGFGVTQMIGSDDDAGSGADSSATAPEVGSNAAPQDAQSEPTQEPEKGAAARDPASSELAAEQPPLPDVPGLSAATDDDRASDSQPQYTSRLAQECGPKELPSGTDLRAASYRGKEALVVYLPPSPTGRQVDVYACTVDPDQPARSLTLPAGE